MLQKTAFFAAEPGRRPVWSAFCMAACLLLTACGGVQPAASQSAGSGGVTSYDLPPSGPSATTGYSSQGTSSSGYSSGYGMPPNAMPPAETPSSSPASSAPASSAPAGYGATGTAQPAGVVQTPGTYAPAWRPLAQRLAADGLSGPRVDALLATLAPTPTQSPMGRKMRELYMRKFFPKPPSTPPTQEYYKGVVTEANAQLCRQFVASNKKAFDQASARYGVPSSIAVSLLFVETRLGKVLADVPENAFYTLASMAVTRQPSDIPEWLGRMPEYEQHLDWFADVMPKRADWAYKEVRALVEYMLRDNIDPHRIPSSIYGAVGLCQFMPSNIATYGADGDGDGRVDLFTVPDAVASLSNYLAKHGWKAGLPRARQHQLLMAYNHAAIYANTILALSDMVAGAPAPTAAPAGKNGTAKQAKPAKAKQVSPAR